MRIAILVSSLSPDAPADELDTLEESRFVGELLSGAGHETFTLDFTSDVASVIAKLRDFSPQVIFNLVETIDGKCRDIHLVPALLEVSDFPFTGSTSIPMALSTDKVLSKIHFNHAGVKTGSFGKCTDFLHCVPFEGPWILKPSAEEASTGIGSFAFHQNVESLRKTINDRSLINNPDEWFVEQYIDGREFNIGIVPDGRDWILFEPAEIQFRNYTPDMPRILDWRAKWDTDSFEYINTVRSFQFNLTEPELSTRIKNLAVKSALALRLDGYSRVDFRMDKNGELFVLEANANPCISPDAGFIAACDYSGFSRLEIFEKILNQPFTR